MITPAAILAGALLAAASLSEPLSAPHPAAWTHVVTDVPGRLAPAAIRVAPASYQDSLITGVCEGPLTPIGIILPASPGTDCGAPTLLRHGWRDGDPGTFVFLDLPPCPDSWCRSLQTSDKLRCEILIGNPCCWLQDLEGKVLPAITGTRMGPITDALQSRFDVDTDRRQGICHADYLGNQARMLRVLIVEPGSSRGRDSYRVLGGGRLFLRERQEKSDDLVGEMIPAP